MPFPPVGELPYLLTLPAHGFYWFRLADDVPAAAVAHRAAAGRGPAGARAVRRLEQLLPQARRAVAHRRWRRRRATQLERELLPRFLQRQRWYAAKDEPLPRVRAGRLRPSSMTAPATSGWSPLADAEAERPSPRATSRRSRWRGKSIDEERLRQLAPVAMAKVRAAGAASACWPTRWPMRRSVAPWCTRSAPATNGRPPTAARCASRRRRVRGVGGAAAAAADAGAPADGEQQLGGADRRTAVPQGVSPLPRRPQSGARDRPLPHRRGARSNTACRWPAASSTSTPTAAPARSRCCKAYVDEPGRRLDAGRSSSWLRQLEGAAQRRRRVARGGRRRAARADARRWRAAPRSCTSRWHAAPAMRRSIPSRSARDDVRAMGARRARRRRSDAAAAARQAPTSAGAARRAGSARAGASAQRSPSASTRSAAAARTASRRATTATTTSVRC